MSKHLTNIVIFVMAGWAAMNAQTTGLAEDKDQPAGEVSCESIVNRAPANYLMGLQRENNGVVQSAIINIMTMYTAYPDQDYDEIIQKLEDLENCSPYHSTRVLAFFARNYLTDPDKFDWTIDQDPHDIGRVLDTMMSQLTSRVQP